MKRLLILCTLFLTQPAPAQTLYRCGKTYQDRSCEATDGQVIGQNRNESAAKIDDPYCKNQGGAAQQIRWKKESGKTEADQINEGLHNEQFIRYVYNKRGSAAEVRSDVEKECLEEKQRRAPQPAPIPSANDKAGAGSDLGSGSRDPTTSKHRVIGQQPNTTSPNNTVSVCQKIDQELTQLLAQQRKGASASELDKNKDDERQKRKELSKLGC